MWCNGPHPDSSSAICEHGRRYGHAVALDPGPCQHWPDPLSIYSHVAGVKATCARCHAEIIATWTTTTEAPQP